MPIRPQDVYDDPNGHWDFLTTPADRDSEGQLFDRKEGCRPRPDGSVSGSDIRNLRDQIVECVSGFANANRDGGLLVVGIASDGSVRGLKHLNENQINRIMKLNDVLLSHGCHSKLHKVAAEDGEQRETALFLVSYAERAVCETVGYESARVGPERIAEPSSVSPATGTDRAEQGHRQLRTVSMLGICRREPRCRRRRRIPEGVSRHGFVRMDDS